MTVALTVNAVIFDYPERGDTSWGPDSTDWASAVTTGMLQKAGGTFALTAEVYFGATYGLKSAYYKSTTSNIAAAGQVRLARTDSISFRNVANSADLALTVNGSDELTFGGGALLSGAIVDAEVDAAAAITLSKLAVVTASRALVSSAGGVITAGTTTAAEIGYVNGVTSAIQTQIDGKATSGSPTFSGNVVITGDLTVNGTTTTLNTATLDVEDKNIKINLGGNDALSEGAGITIDRTGTKGSIIYAAASASRFSIGDLGSEVEVVTTTATQTLTNKSLSSAVISNATATTVPYLNASKVLTSSSVTPTELGYVSGVTSAIQTQLNGKATGGSVVTPGGYPYSAATGDVVLVDTSTTRSINLPTPTANRFVTIKDAIGSAGTNNITVVRAGSEQIEGLAASKVLSTNWGSWTFIANGTNWFMI
jgi:hypothetical protein